MNQKDNKSLNCRKLKLTKEQMKLIPQKPKRTLNKAFLKLRPHRSEIDLFKNNFIRLLGKVDEIEREENQKNHVRDFLRDTFYKESNEINTKDSKDLVIHLGKSNKDKVGVIIEAKRPSNKAEMLTADKPNTKALQELVLYYLRERIEENNIDIKYLVATNVYEWFIIEAAYFEKLFYRNKSFVKQYEDWRDKKKVTSDTQLFYTEIAKPFIDQLEDDIPCTYFDIRDYEIFLKITDKEDDKNLIALLKILSPYHLLKVPFADDSNKLDAGFYKELLHIIGLEEAKENGKQIIRRKKEKPDEGSLIENTIAILETEDLHKITDINSFGDNKEDRLFNIALELCITWINRILFLKLLEGQLVNYHKGDKQHHFLNSGMINDYDELFKLFHQVLARTAADRSVTIQQKYSRVPYLNSSLFEISELEDQTLKINSLDNSAQLDFINSTILKDDKKKITKLPSLDYLFKFLDAYDFASEDAEDIQEDTKTLINTSVLGKVFEKINGYKDGSIFTPGFITMYMCRQAIRLAVVQKFNDKKNWNVKSFDELYNKIDDINEANNIVNDLKLCDPAVGSGHYLVSGLNEIIVIKSELKILQDKNGKRLKEYTVEVENDELYVTDEDGELFKYLPQNKESQRIQETLFHEKQTIIENCLFGVDINPNSVKICQLRLWIELLKNAYYKEETDYKELETLPNIDINIKCGNSLLSRFDLDADLKPALKKSKFTIDAYKLAVQTYREAENKEQKREMERVISLIKNDFTTELNFRDKLAKQYVTEKAKVVKISSEINRIKLWKEKIPKKLLDDLDKASLKLDKLDKEVNDIKTNAIYNNAFEWRFEFPEVLNNKGEFEGFDVVIENPPYVFSRENFTPAMKSYFSENYQTTQYQVNLYLLFIERTIAILKKKGQFSLIVPNSLLMVSSAKNLRKHLLNETALNEIINLMGHTFEGINVETIIISGKKENQKQSDKIAIYVNEGTDFVLTQTKEQRLFMQNPGAELTVFSNTESDELTVKLKEGSEILDNLVLIKAGLQAYETGKGNPKQTPEDVKARPYDYTYKFDKNTFEYLEGKDVKRYELKWSGTFLKYGNHLAAPRTFDIFKGNKIIIREITGKHPQSIVATYSEDIFLFNRSNIAIVEKENSPISLKYVLALLNSRLMSHYFINNTAKSVRQLFPKLILEDLRKFPIKDIDDKQQQPFIDLVDKVLAAKQQGTDTSELEKQIDDLVYKLYELTYDEVKIIDKDFWLSEEEYNAIKS